MARSARPEKEEEELHLKTATNAQEGASGGTRAHAEAVTTYSTAAEATRAEPVAVEAVPQALNAAPEAGDTSDAYQMLWVNPLVKKRRQYQRTWEPRA
ncbi:hypothetical protein PPTG_22500 [Phytophthora nicotianae INRA-310]|uniref:Uncharacterized protein n=1 Tax=Phytophthora nicotianae (strain INRA-310) TaxID=761204 RepID=W2QHZ7_PHYN3|nr:hypothetical protein PPTG_22500 [Phytophthora nicotianae INRA-310]ETN12511.1 hypothetical protein PPTG_22500 [Phytophthora nicotianae INRA-310]